MDKGRREAKTRRNRVDFFTPEYPVCSVASDIDESSVMQLAEMGFPLEACRKAVYFTGNMGAEVAFNWIIVHMEEPGRWSENGRALESDVILSDVNPWSYCVLWMCPRK